MINFEEKGHAYTNVDPKDEFKWVSVTKLVDQFQEPFDAIAISEKCSRGKNPKYAGKAPADIREIWNNESKRSLELGTWYHNQRESDVLGCNTITREGVELPIISPIINNNIKSAPDQNITEGVYPEHLVYLRSANICGQADRIEIVRDVINVYDYKTNKEIKLRGHKYRDGTYKKMLGPVRNLEDCEFNHYALQLSIYMYIINKHNFNLIPGTLQIQHVEFVIDHEDENGYPVHALSSTGEPMISKINRINLPYLKKEVIAMLKWLKVNKEMVLYEH